MGNIYINNESELTDAEVQLLIDAYHILDITERDLHTMNKEYESDEYRRLYQALWSLKKYLTEDFKISSSQLLYEELNDNSHRALFSTPELTERALQCTEQLKELMEQYYALIQEREIHIYNENYYEVNYYWQVVYRYMLSKFNYSESKIKECEDFIVSLTKSLVWLKEQERIPRQHK